MYLTGPISNSMLAKYLFVLHLSISILTIPIATSQVDDDDVFSELIDGRVFAAGIDD